MKDCGAQVALNVCDECRTAFYDEGLMDLSDTELAQVLYLGADIGDHVCEFGGCQCPAHQPAISKKAKVKHAN